MIPIKLCRALEANINNIEYIDGQIIFSDQGNLYIDFPNRNRILVSSNNITNAYIDNAGILWIEQLKGEPFEVGNVVGPQGEKGEQGNGIVSILKTSTNGLIDTYTIKFTNGISTTFTVTNGEKGDTGPQGPAGTSVTHSWNGSNLTITSASGTTIINIDSMLQEKLDAIPTAASQGAIF